MRNVPAVHSRFLKVTLVAVLAATAGPLIPVASGAPQVVSVSTSGIWGGGFMNHVARDPNNSEKFTSAGDVSGLHTVNLATDNWGWTTSNGGFEVQTHMTIASVGYRKHNPTGNTELYAAYGNNGGGLLKSTNGGTEWAPFGWNAPNGGPKFQGQSPQGIGPYALGVRVPRPTGNLLVFDENPVGPVLNYIYAGTFGRGVMRGDANGENWVSVALAAGSSFCKNNPTGEDGCFITSLIPDPVSANLLWASAYKPNDSTVDGVFKIDVTNCGSNPPPNCATVTEIHTSTGEKLLDAQELQFASNGRLLCACGKDGFYRGTTGNASLEKKSSDLDFDTSSSAPTSYAALAAVPSTSTFYLGAFNPFCEVPTGETESECHTLYKTTTAGDAWADLTYGVPESNITYTVAGTSTTWWLSNCPTCGTDEDNDNMIDQPNYNVSAIEIRPTTPMRLIVSGRSGLWVSGTNEQHWQPMVKNMGTTINRDVAYDPKDVLRVYVGDTDWEVLTSTNRLQTIFKQEILGGINANSGFALSVNAMDPDLSAPSITYLAGGNPDAVDDTANEPYMSSDPSTVAFDKFTPTLDTSSECASKPDRRVIGIGVGQINSTEYYVLAATDGCGLWRFNPATSSWAQVTDSTGAEPFVYSADVGTFTFAPIVWPRSTGNTAYVLDRNQGILFKSTDKGATWNDAWTVPDGALDPGTGYIAINPNNVSYVFVTTNKSDGTGLYRLNCTTLPCVTEDIDENAAVYPGPIAFQTCTAPCTPVVFVATRSVTNSSNPALFSSSNAGTNWSNRTSGLALYEQSANFPRHLTVTPATDSRAYVTTGGNGTVIVGGL